jgi:hypothetical protein
VIAKEISDRVSFQRVPMGVEVPCAFTYPTSDGFNFASLTAFFMTRNPPFMFRSGLGDMKRIATHAVSHQLGKNLRSSGFRMFEFFENKNPSSLAITNPSRAASQGRLAFSGSSLRVERARHGGKSANAHGSDGSFRTPAIMTSASQC